MAPSDLHVATCDGVGHTGLHCNSILYYTYLIGRLPNKFHSFFSPTNFFLSFVGNFLLRAKAAATCGSLFVRGIVTSHAAPVDDLQQKIVVLYFLKISF